MYKATITARLKLFICTVSFCCASLNSFAFDTWWHAECTRKAMVANGFSADARLATQVSNYITDFLAVLNMPNEYLAKTGIKNVRFRSDDSYDFLHFDAVFTTADIEKNWRQLFLNTVATLRKYASTSDVEEGFRQIVLFNIIGASLHITQDFYSHSNWVNQHLKDKISPVPIWFDKPLEDIRKMKLYTGIYQKPYNGHVSHEELNKDNSSRTLNKEAVEVAERASIDWVRRLMDSVPEVPWSGLKSYNIQNNMVMKNFLVTQDASFLTSSSIFPMFHFDGKNSVKRVFNQDPVKEYAQADIVLTSILTQYASNIQVPKNKMGLPTPYWAGFMGYHITHSIAGGLSLNNKKYPGGTPEIFVEEEDEKLLPNYDPKKPATSPVTNPGKSNGSSSPAKGNSAASSNSSSNNSSSNNTSSGNTNPGKGPVKTGTTPSVNNGTGGMKKDSIKVKKPQ